jgi:hypothetical protein
VKAYEKGHGDVKIWEKIHLDGAGARGHVDCVELVNGTGAVARAIPIVSATDGSAKVTHEAAIGSIDKKQVETLMARGLDESEAVDVIVKGILR